MSSIPLSLSTKKKSNLQILHITFCKLFFNLKNRNGLPNNYFLFLILQKFFLKVRAKHIKYKNYYLKTNFKFNFLKIVFILFWKLKQKSPYQSNPYMERFFSIGVGNGGLRGTLIKRYIQRVLDQKLTISSVSLSRKGGINGEFFFHWRREKGRPMAAP